MYKEEFAMLMSKVQGVNVAQQYKIGKSKKLKNSSKGAVLFTRLEQTLEKISF